MKCSVAKQHMSSYLDAAATRSEMTALQSHMDACSRCATDFIGLQRAQQMVGSLGRKAAPADVALKLRVSLSQEVANAKRSRWEALRVRWENVFNAVMVPATGGLITTIVMFGLLINFLVPAQVAGANDVPTTFYTPPELRSSPFEVAMDPSRSEPLIVEAYVGADGRVQDYRILSGPEDMKALPAELKNVLIFTTFRPATSFGRPTSSRAILSFSKIQVKG